MLAIALILLLGFFYIYLPNTTNHGETITVPNMVGEPFDKIDEYLTTRNLRYEVTIDSTFSFEYPAHTILQQYPGANAQVKENRKIYVTLNMAQPPKVKMPDLIDGSVKSAEMILKSYGLVVGKKTFKPDLAFNAVLEQNYDGEPIAEGTYIEKGSKIDLVVGDGHGAQAITVPGLIGEEFENAELIVSGSDLNIGAIIPVEPNDTLIAGTVTKQVPGPGETVRVGEDIDLWVVDYDNYIKDN